MKSNMTNAEKKCASSYLMALHCDDVASFLDQLISLKDFKRQLPISKHFKKSEMLANENNNRNVIQWKCWYIENLIFPIRVSTGMPCKKLMHASLKYQVNCYENYCKS